MIIIPIVACSNKIAIVFSFPCLLSKVRYVSVSIKGNVIPVNAILFVFISLEPISLDPSFDPTRNPIVLDPIAFYQIAFDLIALIDLIALVAFNPIRFVMGHLVISLMFVIVASWVSITAAFCIFTIT
eukprot:scaffold269809_cov35-Attheya_sp.AAC.1